MESASPSRASSAPDRSPGEESAPRRPAPGAALDAPRGRTTALFSPLGAEITRGRRLAVQALLVFAGVGAALYGAHVAGLIVAGPATLYDDWLYHAILLAGAAACLARAAWIRHDRVAWGLMGGAILLWTAGDLHWTFFLSDDESPPFPSVADALYLGIYPLAYVAFVLLVRRMVRRFHASIWLDGLIGALTVAALGAGLVVGPVLEGVGGSLAAVATNAAYPLGDLLLLVFVVGVFALLGWRPGRGWAMVGLAFALLAVADSAYLYMVAAGTYVEGAWLDALWPFGMVVLAFAAWQPLRAEGPLRFEGWPVLVAPIVFAIADVALLVVGNLRGLNTIALGLAVAALAAVLVRTALTFREVQSLPETRRQAETDELTGLANRRYFFADLKTRLDAAQAADGTLAILMIDLDRFKELNDTLGHYVGDLLLRKLGTRLAGILREGEGLARLGGDEFAIVLPDARSANLAAERVTGSLERPFLVDDVTLHIDASIGIALFPDHAQDADGLLQRADVAMYQAKAEHSGYSFYAQERDQHSREKLEMIGELREAIEQRQLVVRYQPKTDTQSGRVIGAEALVRWQHPRRGLVLPGDFIALAEQTGVMRPLTLYVLDAALRQCADWLENGHELTMAVNISATNLLDLTFPADVERLLAETGVPARLLQLEITENVLMADPERARVVIATLSRQGVEIALDDFGTGYSSLAYLRQLAVDELKIDRSFVLTMGTDESSAAIVRSLVDLAKSMRIRTVAEGVETEDVLERLAALGCEQAQGFLFSRPLSGDQFERWMAERYLPEAKRPLSAAPPVSRASSRT